jgi:hypothetical protein
MLRGNTPRYGLRTAAGAGLGPAPGVRSGIAVRSPLREMRLMRHGPGSAH